MRSTTTPKWILLFTLLLTLAGVLAHSHVARADSNCAIPALDGDKVPFPISIKGVNTKYALAENETYILTGTIELFMTREMFKIDLDSQPWLASPKRIANPYYPIDPAQVPLVRKFIGQKVQMVVVTRHGDSESVGGQAGLMLSPIIAPVSFE